MALTEDWIETDPDGAVITVSQLDDYQRQAKRAVRERLEGDPTNPLTGLLEVNSFAAAPMPRAGSARVYTGTDAAIQALAVGYRQDGRLGYATDTKRLYHIGAAAVVEVGYMSTSGPNTQTQASSKNPSLLVRDLAATALAANALFAGNGTQIVTQSHDSNARFASVSFAGQSQFIGYRANGNSGAITGVVNGSTLVSFEGRGYTSAGAWTQGGAGGLQVIGTEAWSAVANGSKVILFVTANGATANTTALTIGQDTNATFVGTVTATSFVGNVTGSAATLNPGRTINGVAFDGSANITVTALTNGTLTFGTHLTGGSFNGSNVTLATDATDSNVINTIMSRSSSGNVEVNAVLGSLLGNASTATALQTSRTIWGQAFTGAANVTGALTYGGVTLNNVVTGTGNMVLSASPTITGTLTTAAISATSGAFSTTLNVTGASTLAALTATTIGGTTITGTAHIQTAAAGSTYPFAAVPTATNIGGYGFFDTANRGSVWMNSSDLSWNWNTSTTTSAMSLTTGGILTTVGEMRASNFRAGAPNAFYFNGRTEIRSPSDGTLQLWDSANTGFLRLMLGGSTASYPAIKRSGVDIHFRLADDSDWATTVMGAAAIVAGGKLYIDSGGDTYIIETSANVMDHFCGGTKALSLTATTATFAGSITTAAPAGAAAPWKFGSATTSGGLGTNTTLEVNVAGTTYAINAHT